MQLRRSFAGFLIFGLCLIMAGCSGDNPVSSVSDTGTVKISIMGSQSAGSTLTKSFNDGITVTSAKVVIEKVEFENERDASLDFKFDQPFVQDLLTLTSLQEIETVEIPFGTYDEIKIAIDDLDAEDGEVYTQNPDLQDLSVVVTGFLNDDPAETFQFSSDLSVNVDLQFEPPLEISEQFLSTNIVLAIDFAKWFNDRNGNFLDPGVAENRSQIENNIKRSLRVFEDRDDDGRRDEDGHGHDDGQMDDDDIEIKGVISDLGEGFLVVSDKTFHVDAETTIEGDDDSLISFSDLMVGFVVEIHAVEQSDGSLLARRIEVEDDFNDDDEDREDREVKGRISELESDHLVVSGLTFFVDENTVITDDDEHSIALTDLMVGQFVEIHAARLEDGTLLATRIEVEDDNKDGDNDDEDKEVEGVISELGEDFLLVSGTKFMVDADTHIEDDDEHVISFSDLEVGMFVEVHAMIQSDGSYIARKIEVEDDHDHGDHDDDGHRG